MCIRDSISPFFGVLISTMEIIHQRKYDSRDVISYSNLMGLELELLERDNEFDSTKRMGLKKCCDVTVDVESRGHIWAAPKAAFSSKLGPSNRSKILFLFIKSRIVKVNQQL